MGSLIINSLHNHCWLQGWKKFENQSTLTCRSYGQLSRGSFCYETRCIMQMNKQASVITSQQWSEGSFYIRGIQGRCFNERHTRSLCTHTPWTCQFMSPHSIRLKTFHFCVTIYLLEITPAQDTSSKWESLQIIEAWFFLTSRTPFLLPNQRCQSTEYSIRETIKNKSITYNGLLDLTSDITKRNAVKVY